MKRIVLAMVATAIVSLTIGSALAATPDFSSGHKITQFWDDRVTNGAGASGQ